MGTFLVSTKEYLMFEVWGNTGLDFLIALGVFLVACVAIKIFKKIILTRIEKWAKKTKTDLDDELLEMIESIPEIFYGYISFYIALQYLSVHSMINKLADAFLIILVFFWATKAVSNLIEYLLYKFSKKEDKKREKTTTYFALSLVIKILLWGTGLLLILANLGVDITALVASMGIGGIAIALAAQNILSDLFSSFSIYFDKPFEIGDYVVVGDQSGTVKKIGLKTTRVEALQGEEIIFANRELTSSQIRNFKKMKKRRISFGFGVTYNTPTKKLRAIPKLIKAIFKKAKKIDLDRVHFKNFGDFSLNYEVVYYINSREYADYMDAQQKINLAIMDAFEKEGIEMAFPTQTLYVNKD